MFNPFYETLLTWPRDELMWDFYHQWQPKYLSVSYDKLHELPPQTTIQTRDDLCRKYSWAIPDPASVAFVARYLGKNAIEIGAGVGYWAYVLSQLKTYVICYDRNPPHLSGGNGWHSPRTPDDDELTGETRPVYYPVYYGTHTKAARYDCPLFLCWPPYATPMACMTLKAYAGNRLVYIGETWGGCTAADDFFELLEKEWEEVDNHMPMQWSGVHDHIIIYERRNKR